MFAERPPYSFLASRLAFKRLPGKPGCEQHPQGCPADTLRETVTRLSALVRQKDALLQEQEILRAESDHRLLNGLQMVVSLLSLQSRAAATAATADVAMQLSVAANRVATIERVHRRLHFNDGAKTVALKRYLQEFCRDFSSIAASDTRPECEIAVQGCDIDLPAATAIPLGFIANELITNAVKHGTGRIAVDLARVPKGYVLSVCNDGAPLPNGFDPTACKGLGMKIIRSLIQKIGGEFQFGRRDKDQGARFAVLFS